MILLLTMSQANPSLTSPVEAAAIAPEQDAAWTEVERLLRRAAKLAGSSSDSGDAFMQAAWAAFLEERPGLREALEDKELRSQLKKLRKKGLIGQA